MLKYYNRIKRFPIVCTNGWKSKRNAYFIRKTRSLKYSIHKCYLLWMTKNEMKIKKNFTIQSRINWRIFFADNILNQALWFIPECKNYTVIWDTSGLIHQIFNYRVNPQIIISAGWLIGLVDFNQSSNGLHNSQTSPGVKSLENKGLGLHNWL